ncbi:MAG: cyclic nucleotide-binding domain-containing protein [Verrucomicrobiota bacterium]
MYSVLEKIVMLKSVHLFSEMPNESLAALAMVLSEQEIPRGVDVLTKGTMGNSLFILAVGSVSVHDGLGTEMAVLQANDFFGEFAALVSEMRMATVTTLERSVFFVLEQAHLFDIMLENRDVLQALITTLVTRMRVLLHSSAQQQASLAQLAAAEASRHELGFFGSIGPERHVLSVA